LKTNFTPIKKSGTKKIVRKVPVSIPPIKPRPIACCAPAPAPDENASGNKVNGGVKFDIVFVGGDINASRDDYSISK